MPYVIPLSYISGTPQGCQRRKIPKRPLGDRRLRQTGRGRRSVRLRQSEEWRVESGDMPMASHQTLRPSKGRGLGETIRFPQFVRPRRTKESQLFSPRRVRGENSLTQAPWARSPVRRLVRGDLKGGRSPLFTRELPRTSSGTPPGPPRPPWAWRCRWTPAGRPRSCGPSGCRSPRPWRRPPRRRPAPCWG